MLHCKYCQKELETIDSLRIHSAKIHKLSSQQVYDTYFLEGDRPKCKCGCGNDVPFNTLQKGYKEWIRGHISKVNNNWGHNKTAIENSVKTRRERFETGDIQVWNVGLTKETDDRVKQNGIGRKLAFNDIIKNEYADRMRKKRLDGTIPTRWGKEAANWKGGTSSINNLVRVNKRLYDEWIYPILCRDEFKCVKCGSNQKLEVHHNKEMMSEIIAKYVDKNCEYTFDEKRKIMNKVIDYHISNEVDGETLCKICHSELHPSYNV